MHPHLNPLPSREREINKIYLFQVQGLHFYILTYFLLCSHPSPLFSLHIPLPIRENVGVRGTSLYSPSSVPSPHRGEGIKEKILFSFVPLFLPSSCYVTFYSLFPLYPPSFPSPQWGEGLG